MKHSLALLMACSVLSGFAAQKTVDEAAALQLVKSQRAMTTADTANFYIGTVTNYINESYCPVDEALASQQKWLVSSQDKWLVFANEEPLMTWTHNCTYYYVPKSYDGDGPAPVFAVKGTLPPLKERLTLIERNVNQPSYNGKQLVARGMARANEKMDNPYGKKIHAVLMCIGSGENTKGRYDACSGTYKMLTDLYGVPKENISLLLDDNSSANLDDGSGQFSHDIDGDNIDEEILVPNIKNLYRSIAHLRNKTGMFLFYYFGEIGRSKNGNVRMLYFKNDDLENLSTFTEQNLAEVLSYISAKYNNIVIVGSASNGFSPHTHNTTTTTSSGDIHFKATEEQQLAFASTWIEGQCPPALKADTDKSGYVSMEENCNYIEETLKDLYNGNFPYIVSTPAGLKGKLALNNIPEISGPMIRDNIEDTGNEPNTSSKITWNSPDIWVRNNDDGLNVQESEHIKGDSVGMVHIYVRLNHNGGEVADNDPERLLSLYWSIKELGCSTEDLIYNESTGGKIAEIILRDADALAPNSSLIRAYSWQLPEVLRKRIISNEGVLDIAITAIITKRYEEVVDDKYFNTALYNTAARSTITVVDPSYGQQHRGDRPIDLTKEGVKIPVVIHNNSAATQKFNLNILPNGSIKDNNAFEFSEITMYLGNKLHKSWVANGKSGTDIKNYTGEPQRIYLKSPNSSINGIELAANSSDTIFMTIQTFAGMTSTFKLDDTFHLTLADSDNNLIDGTAFRVLINGSGSDIAEPVIGEINPGIGSLGTLTANNISQQAACKWMDKDHNTLGTGKSLTIDLGKSRREYILKVTSAKDNSVAYAYTEPIGIQISGISPNPCSSQICISTNVPTSSGTAISITNVDGTWHKNVPVKEGETQIEVSTADFPAGRYFVSLIVDGNVISNKQIVKL